MANVMALWLAQEVLPSSEGGPDPEEPEPTEEKHQKEYPPPSPDFHFEE